MDAIERAIELAGSAAKLAEDIGVSPQYMSQLRSGTRPVPAERCPNIERATNGAVRCEDLRPDVDWAYLRSTDCGVVKVGAGDTAPTTTREAA